MTCCIVGLLILSVVGRFRRVVGGVPAAEVFAPVACRPAPGQNDRRKTFANRVPQGGLAKRLGGNLSQQRLQQIVQETPPIIAFRTKQRTEDRQLVQGLARVETRQFGLHLRPGSRGLPGLKDLVKVVLRNALRSIVAPQRLQFRADQHPELSLNNPA